MSSQNHVHAEDEQSYDSERSTKDAVPLKRSWFRALVQDFQPIWFTWCMNAGIIGILLHQYNYQFPGIGVLSTIAFLVDFTLFIIFTSIMLLRFAWFGKQAFSEITGDAMTLPLLACWPIAWMTSVAFVALVVSQASWGGHAFTIVAYVMWWFGLTWTLCTLFFVFYTTIIHHSETSLSMPPAYIIPAVGVATVATIGGLLSTYATDVSARLAVPVIIMSYFMVGIALFLAIILYTFILHRIFARSFPPPDQTVNLFMLVGPMGQVSAALQIHGSAASMQQIFALYKRGTFLTAEAAHILDAAGVLLGMLIAGFGVFWLIMAFIAVGYRIVRWELKWNLSCNSVIFPMGTFTTAMLQFGTALDSPFFKVITGILTVFLVIIFFVNLGFASWEVAHGRLLIVREDWRVKQRLEEEKDGKED